MLPTVPTQGTTRRFRSRSRASTTSGRTADHPAASAWARTKVMARTVGTISEEPTTVQGWRETAASLAPEERLVVGAVTLTRGKGRNAMFRATDRRPDRLTPDGKSARWQTRTPDALALKLA